MCDLHDEHVTARLIPDLSHRCHTGLTASNSTHHGLQLITIEWRSSAHYIQLVISLRVCCLQAASDWVSETGSERVSKQHFFEQTEAQWCESHASEPVDYALLNRLHSDSIGPESSSSPDQTPQCASNRQEGMLAR